MISTSIELVGVAAIAVGVLLLLGLGVAFLFVGVALVAIAQTVDDQAVVEAARRRVALIRAGRARRAASAPETPHVGPHPPPLDLY